MATADIAARAAVTADIATPRSKPSLLSKPFLPSLAARIGAWLAARLGCVLRFGDTVVVVRHADVREVLARDLDFCIGPINAVRIEEVNGPFVLGMDRGPVLDHERSALYRAFHQVDMASLRDQVQAEARRRVATAGNRTIDVVGGYARPIAAQTAATLFGVSAPSEQLLMDVARAVFAHTFLNIENEEVVRKRALAAGAMMHDWFATEIAKRLALPDPGHDLMGQLIRLQQPGPVDVELVRRTLGGMLVGAIDTTATCVAKIIAVLGRDPALAAQVARDVDQPDRLRGWCWEALRRWPHNPVVLRQAAATTTLNGQEVRQGDRIFVWTQAAMLDATVFPDPGRLRPDRPQGNYLHFGGALHACAGRAVNGFQIPILVGELVRQGIVSVGKMAWAGPFPDELPVVLAR
jgi:cytochrome P450